jgi:predicted nucleic acid-binding protein
VNAYFDASVITKWYLPEADSARALRVRARFSPPAVLTHLHRLELVTAWELKIFRREISRTVVERAWSHVEDDIEAGIWELPVCEFADVFSQAELLSRRHAAALGTRSLDVLHVAFASVLGASAFVTADVRQAKLATAAGMRVASIGR